MNLRDSYARVEQGEVFLLNVHISPYSHRGYADHEPLRRRKLLLQKREIRKLIGNLRRSGMTLVPLSLYFNERGRAKVEIALATGKRKYDKRQAEKERDWKRNKERLMRADN